MASCGRCVKSTVWPPESAQLWPRWQRVIDPPWIEPPATRKCLSDRYWDGGGVLGAVGAIPVELVGVELVGDEPNGLLVPGVLFANPAPGCCACCSCC